MLLTMKLDIEGPSVGHKPVVKMGSLPEYGRVVYSETGNEESAWISSDPELLVEIEQ